MIQRLADEITRFLKVQNIVSEDDSKQLAVCHYGIEITIASVVNFALIFLLGAATGTFWDCLVFLAVFVPLRQCTGGYHAETYLLCNTVLAATYLSIAAAARLLPMSLYGLAALWAASWSIVCLFAPCENKHKKLSAAKKKRFRYVSIVLWIAFGGCGSYLYLIVPTIAKDIIFTMFGIAILIVIDRIKHKKEKRNEAENSKADS